MRTSKYSALAVVIATAVALAGCSGSDGAAGATGPTGPSGPSGPQGQPPQLAEQCEACHSAGKLADAAAFHNEAALGSLQAGKIVITAVTFPATTVQPQISFTVYGPDCGQPTGGNAVPTLSPTCGPVDFPAVNYQPIPAFNFTVAKYVTTQPAGENPYWVPYVYASNTAGAVPSSERSCGSGTNSTTGLANCLATTGQLVGTLTKVPATIGQYVYTFKSNLAAATAPGSTAVIYDPAALTRFGVQTGNNQQFANGTLDVTPPAIATGGPGTTPTTPATPIVSTAACNQCHKRLAIHGRRVLEDYCVTCHDPSLVAGGQSGDMVVMIHKWHAGKQLNLDYSFAGVVATEITYPQDVRNCNTCHQTASGTELPAWYALPSYTACFTCHKASGHPVPVTASTNCKLCHNSTATDALNPQIAHRIFEQEASKAFAYKILNVTGFKPGQTTVVTLAVLNPITTPATTYDIKAATGPWSYAASGASRLFVDIGWSHTDIRNVGNGVAYGQPIQIDVLAKGVVDPVTKAITVTSPLAIPAAVTGSLTVAIEGHPAVINPSISPATTVPSRIPVTNVSKAYNVTGNSAVARRTVVDIAKCNECHFNLSLHGNNRTGDITTCMLCHNTEATDGSRRPAAGGIDGLPSVSIDFKSMIHKIHSAQVVVYGFGGSVNDFEEVTYPAPLSNCQACHVTPPADMFPVVFSYDAPDAAAWGSTTNAGADKVGNADNLRTTKWTAVCNGCHSEAASVDHMRVNGAGFGLTQAEIDALNQ